MGRGDSGAPVVVPQSEWNAAVAALFGVDTKSGSTKRKPRDKSAADAARRMETAKKAAAREALRRKAERRVYKPANAWMLCKLAAMFGGFVLIVLCQLFASALAGYLNPDAVWLTDAQNVWWRCLVCLALCGLPAMLSHLCGYLLFPPVWGERFPDRERALEELGGRLHFRFHHPRGNNPGRTKKAVEVCAEVLSRTLPSALWEIEVVTEDDLYVAAGNVREFVFSSGKNGKNVTNVIRHRTNVSDLLTHASERSVAQWGDWVVHMGVDAVLNQRAVDAIVFHCARESRLVALSPSKTPRARRAAQGAVYPGLTRTANDIVHGVPTMFAWIPAMAEVVRAGECHGSIRLSYAAQRVVSPVPECFMVLPVELERSTGHLPSPPRTEMTHFALRAQGRGAQIAWLDAGVHVTVTPGMFALFRLRVADAANNMSLWRQLGTPIRHDVQQRSVSTKGNEDDAGTEDAGTNPQPRVDAVTRFQFATLCVSSVLAKTAPVLVVCGAWAKRSAGTDSLYLACALGAVAALVHFQYAVGFYASSGARHLAKGVPGFILYWILFFCTLALVPVFSAFELLAAATALVWTPRGYGISAGRSGTKDRSRGKTSSKLPPSPGDESSDGLLGSDGEVRRSTLGKRTGAGSFTWGQRGTDTGAVKQIHGGGMDLEAPLLRRGPGSVSSGDGTDSGDDKRTQRQQMQHHNRRLSTSTQSSARTASSKGKQRWGIGSSKSSAAPVKSGNHQA